MSKYSQEPEQDEMSLMYQRARMEWDERIGNTVNQLKSWRIIAILSLTIAAIAVIGISYIGAQSKIQPYALAMSDNKVIALQQLRKLPNSEMELVRRSIIGGFIEGIRSVYSDPSAQRAATLRAYSHLRGNDPAWQQVTTYLSKIAPPNKRAETELVSVDIISVFPMGTGNTYQIEWKENIVDRKGALKAEPTYRALITTAYQAPTPKGFMQNPTGLWIETYQVTEIN